MTVRDPTPQSRVNLADTYITHHMGEKICLRDLAGAADVSVRTLGYLFLRVYGTTPMHYVKARRLARVHRLLRNADPATDTVNNIARSCGFLHMGQFSRDYKRIVGEMPSTTLRKMPAEFAKAGTAPGTERLRRRHGLQ